MRRASAGTRATGSASKQTVPASGPSSPARARSVDRLAGARRAEDGQAVAGRLVRHAQVERADRDVEVEADAGGPGVRRMDLAGQRGGVPSARRPGLGDGQHDHGDTQRERGRRLGGRDAGAGELHVGEHRQRVGVVGEQHGRAVLADGPQPGQQQPGADAGGGDRRPTRQKRASGRWPRVAARSSSAGSTRRTPTAPR